MRTPRKVKNRFLLTGISFGIAMPFLLSSCTMSSGIPGVPDIKLEASKSAAQSACEAYARAWSLGTTRESILAGLENAQAIASASSENEANQVARAIDEVLANSVIGTQDSLYAANDNVIAACGTVGVSIQMEE